MTSSQGTVYFMAIGRINDTGVPHGVHHDLESFFWVLVWVVVRHVAHEHQLGDKLCSAVFYDGNGKMKWLTGQGMGKHFTVPGNAPLTDLLQKLTVIVGEHVMGENLDYEKFLAPFEEALARDDWPVGDRALSFKAPSLRTNTVCPPEQPTSQQRRHHRTRTETTGSKRKASTLEIVHEDLPESDCDDLPLPDSEEAVECALLAWCEYDELSSEEDDLSSPIPFSEEGSLRRSVRRKVACNQSSQDSGMIGRSTRRSSSVCGAGTTTASGSQPVTGAAFKADSRRDGPASGTRASRRASSTSVPRVTSARHPRRVTRSQTGSG